MSKMPKNSALSYNILNIKYKMKEYSFFIRSGQNTVRSSTPYTVNNMGWIGADFEVIM